MSTRKQTDKIKLELQEIAKANDGILKAEDVVEFAKDSTTAMHDCFEWDDSEAAERYRKWQARQLIRVHVVVVEEDSNPIRAFVSLKDDRADPGGGYRDIYQVMSDEDMRKSLLKQAFSEMSTFRKKYNSLKELTPVFAAFDKVEEQQPKLFPVARHDDLSTRVVATA